MLKLKCYLLSDDIEKVILVFYCKLNYKCLMNRLYHSLDTVFLRKVYNLFSMYWKHNNENERQIIYYIQINESDYNFYKFHKNVNIFSAVFQIVMKLINLLSLNNKSLDA